ncbi:HTH_XRE domain containing protein [uncultured Caudovirales phage]|uniref:HTH_XRE domain containing protein n=1 Tax=uncultured Caudovirales phage TaxID=2100421 RepID=A0A6J5PGG0_9CAUD|nr:HTH_XRE domain containing protein [uncultured Caudovirales phage]CAB4168976.1 HTH_XRE domain containing protein [uncultured Caudovirales phage]CAB4195566.1 HTH_XRE domain containing protein [uncultured Caudovirales phage]
MSLYVAMPKSLTVYGNLCQPQSVKYLSNNLNMELKQILAVNLHALMRRQKLTQMGLKAKSGIAQATIGRVLRKETAADLDTLQALAKATGVSPWQLLIPNLDPTNPPPLPPSEHERDLYERLRSAAELIVQKNH